MSRVFGKKKQAESVDRSRVMKAMSASMKAWDRDDMECSTGRRSAELRRLEREREKAHQGLNKSERDQVARSLRRHGYPG